MFEEEYKAMLDKKYAKFEKRIISYIKTHGMSISFWKQWGARLIKPTFLGFSLFVDYKFNKDVSPIYQAPIFYYLARFCSENNLDCSIGYFDKEKTKSEQFFISSLEFSFISTPREKEKSVEKEVTDKDDEIQSSLDF